MLWISAVHHMHRRGIESIETSMVLESRKMLCIRCTEPFCRCCLLPLQGKLRRRCRRRPPPSCLWTVTCLWLDREWSLAAPSQSTIWLLAGAHHKRNQSAGRIKTVPLSSAMFHLLLVAKGSKTINCHWPCLGDQPVNLLPLLQYIFCPEFSLQESRQEFLG